MEEQHCWEDIIGEQERLISANYDTRRGFGSNPALLLIDLYKKVFGTGREPIQEALETFPSSCGEAAWDAVPPLAEILSAARSSGIPVVHTTAENRTGKPGLGATRRHVDAASQPADDLGFFEPFKPRQNEFVLRKSRASAFFGTPLATHLRLCKAETLIVGGESTSGCVRATVVDAFSLGFNVVVCEEAVFDRSPVSHKASLFDMHLKYAKVAHLTEVLDYLARSPSRITDYTA